MRPNWFIAIPVPALSWFSPLVAHVPRGIRRFHPEDLHLTVAFLGPVRQEDALTAWARVENGPDHRTIDARLASLRPMGNRRRPSAFAAILAEGR
ncbi:MAG: hypothetical protein AAFV53_28005, partial [Myxococcota bacterium]